MGYSQFYKDHEQIFKERIEPMFENMNPPQYEFMYKQWIYDLARDIQDSGLFTKSIYHVEECEGERTRVYNHGLIKVWFRVILRIYKTKFPNFNKQEA